MEKSKTWLYTAGNILNAFAMLAIYLQMRIIYTLAWWMPIMTFKTWCWVDDSAYVRRDFRNLVYVYAHCVAIALFVYIDWLYCLIFVVFFAVANIVIRQIQVKRFLKERLKVAELTGLELHEISKIMHEEGCKLSGIVDMFNAETIVGLRSRLDYYQVKNMEV